MGWIGAYWLRFALNDTLGAQINPFDAYFRALPLIVGPWMFTCKCNEPAGLFLKFLTRVTVSIRQLSIKYSNHFSLIVVVEPGSDCISPGNCVN